ncbi:MAG: hypothetical protein PVF26_20425 [Desulfobacterales bacterium]|jgi:hypothetical protein
MTIPLYENDNLNSKKDPGAFASLQAAKRSGSLYSYSALLDKDEAMTEYFERLNSERKIGI